jgi:hypothetical protein
MAKNGRWLATNLAGKLVKVVGDYPAYEDVLGKVGEVVVVHLDEDGDPVCHVAFKGEPIRVIYPHALEVV